MSQNRCQFAVSRPRLSFFERPKQRTVVYLFEEKKEKEVVVCCGLPTVEGSEFCIVHKCQIPECLSGVRKRSYEHVLSSYCEEHTCHSGNICMNPCPKGDSTVCDIHRCLLCSHEMFDETGYCHDHLMAIRCHANECTNYVVIERPLDKYVSPYWWCCEHVCHICEKTAGRPESQICYLCQCECTGCLLPKKSKSCYCEAHTETMCQYTVGCRGRCQKMAGNGFKWCQDHKCSYRGCCHHIFEYDDEDGGYRSFFCHQHDNLNKLLRNYRLELGALQEGVGLCDEHADKLLQEIKLRADRIQEGSRSCSVDM